MLAQRGPDRGAKASGWLGRLLGAAVGLFAGLFGVAAGFLIGFMLDEARAEARSRRRIEAYLRDPDGPAPDEPYPGLAAALALSSAAEWGDHDKGPLLFARLAREELPEDRRTAGFLNRLVEAVRVVPPSSQPALARALALRAAPAIRALMGRFAYELLASRGDCLGHGADGAIWAALADCGLGAEEITEARRRSFPAYKDPWAVLGLERGAGFEEVRRAWRRLSRECHPDLNASGGAQASADAAGRFRELREAYEALRPARS